MCRARKLCLRLGGDPADAEYPDKPKRMRWTTYNRLMDKLVAADGVADERLILLAARDGLNCPNALFLDGGSAPSLYAPSLNRPGNIVSLGPMLAVFERE
jgi:hypothetical protein